MRKKVGKYTKRQRNKRKHLQKLNTGVSRWNFAPWKFTAGKDIKKFQENKNIRRWAGERRRLTAEA